MTKRLIRRPEVEHLTGLSRSSIYSRVKEGSFPAPVPLGGRTVGWLEASVMNWIDEQIESAASDK